MIYKQKSLDQLDNVMAGRNSEYWRTLERLLDSKMQADYEETLQDELADLGRDMMNFIAENNSQINARLVEMMRANNRQDDTTNTDITVDPEDESSATIEI